MDDDIDDELYDDTHGLADLAYLMSDTEVDQMIQWTVDDLVFNPLRKQSIWAQVHRTGLADLARLLCDQDPALGIELGLYPDGAARPVIEDWDLTRHAIALKLLIKIIHGGRLDEFLALVNQAKDRMLHSYDDLHWASAEVAIGAIEWGDFPYR
ncbi:MAG: hypothetical protein WCF12_04585 [Propionicimonas sp.]